MSKQDVKIAITTLSLDATRVRFAEGTATIQELALAVRRANAAKGAK